MQRLCYVTMPSKPSYHSSERLTQLTSPSLESSLGGGARYICHEPHGTTEGLLLMHRPGTTESVHQPNDVDEGRMLTEAALIDAGAKRGQAFCNSAQQEATCLPEHPWLVLYASEYKSWYKCVATKAAQSEGIAVLLFCCW